MRTAAARPVRIGVVASPPRYRSATSSSPSEAGDPPRKMPFEGREGTFRSLRRLRWRSPRPAATKPPGGARSAPSVFDEGPRRGPRVPPRWLTPAFTGSSVLAILVAHRGPAELEPILSRGKPAVPAPHPWGARVSSTSTAARSSRCGSRMRCPIGRARGCALDPVARQRTAGA